VPWHYCDLQCAGAPARHGTANGSNGAPASTPDGCHLNADHGIMERRGASLAAFQNFQNPQQPSSSFPALGLTFPMHQSCTAKQRSGAF